MYNDPIHNVARDRAEREKAREGLFDQILSAVAGILTGKASVALDRDGDRTLLRVLPDDEPRSAVPLIATVDGLMEDGTYDSEGQYAPFRIFIPNAQEYLRHEFTTRAAAQVEADKINNGDYRG